MRLRSLLCTLAVLPLIGAGCISISNAPKKNEGGGVFRSADKAMTWAQTVAWPTAKGVQSISGVDVTTFAFDPQDPKALYVGTAANGLFVSYDAGDSWSQAAGLPNTNVSQVAVHPKDKCTIYVTVGNRLLKSTDCSRTFQVAYTDPRAEAKLTTLTVDWYSPNRIYLGTGAGDLLRSTDDGASWAAIKRFDDAVLGFIVSSADSRRMWVGTKGRGFHTSADLGETWTNLSPGMADLDGAGSFIAMVQDHQSPNTLIHASRYGLLKSVDAGTTWQKINILTPPNTVVMTALAMSQNNSADLYYTTASKIYRTKDGGISWTASDLPTTRAASALVVNPADDSVVFLGVVLPKK